MSRDEDAFLAAIRANPTDDVARLAYADWLEERGDPRGRVVRLECQIAQAWEELFGLLPGVDERWAGVVFRRSGVVLIGYPPERKILVIKLIRELTGLGLAEAKALSESLPARLPVAPWISPPGASPLPAWFAHGWPDRPLTRTEAEAIRERFRAIGALVEVTPRAGVIPG